MKKLFLSLFSALCFLPSLGFADGTSLMSLSGKDEVPVHTSYSVTQKISENTDGWEITSQKISYEGQLQDVSGYLVSGSAFDLTQGSRTISLQFLDPGEYQIIVSMRKETNGVLDTRQSRHIVFVPQPIIKIEEEKEVSLGNMGEYKISLSDFPTGYTLNTLKGKVKPGNKGIDFDVPSNGEVTSAHLGMTDIGKYSFWFDAGDVNGETMEKPKIEFDKGSAKETWDLQLAGQKKIILVEKTDASDAFGTSRPFGVPFEFYFDAAANGVKEADYEFQWKVKDPSGNDNYENKGALTELVLEHDILKETGRYEVVLDIYKQDAENPSFSPSQSISVVQPALGFSLFSDKNRSQVLSGGKIPMGAPVYFSFDAQNLPYGTYKLKAQVDDEVFLDKSIVVNAQKITWGKDNTALLANDLQYLPNLPDGVDEKNVRITFWLEPQDSPEKEAYNNKKDWLTADLDNQFLIVRSIIDRGNGTLEEASLDGEPITQGSCLRQNFTNQYLDATNLVDYYQNGERKAAPIPPTIKGHPDQMYMPCFCFSRCINTTGNEQNCDDNKIERYATVFTEIIENGERKSYAKAVPAPYCVEFSMPIVGELSVHGRTGADVISGFVRLLYLFAASIIGLVAVLVILVSGIQMILTGISDAKEDAKNRIGQAILSMVILFMSATILRTINPEFFRGGGASELAEQRDTDKDKIPDFWELEHQLDPNNPFDALQDPDGDKVSNLKEYAYDCDPWIKDEAGTCGN